MYIEELLRLTEIELQNLQQLDLGYNNLGSLSLEQFVALSEALGKCQQLQQLDLKSNNLGSLSPEQFKAFCEALGKCQQLQQLNLSEKNLGSLSSKKFNIYCEALGKCKGLQKLELFGISNPEIENHLANNRSRLNSWRKVAILIAFARAAKSMNAPNLTRSVIPLLNESSKENVIHFFENN